MIYLEHQRVAVCRAAECTNDRVELPRERHVVRPDVYALPTTILPYPLPGVPAPCVRAPLFIDPAVRPHADRITPCEPEQEQHKLPDNGPRMPWFLNSEVRTVFEQGGSVMLAAGGRPPFLPNPVKKAIDWIIKPTEFGNGELPEHKRPQWNPPPRPEAGRDKNGRREQTRN